MITKRKILVFVSLLFQLQKCQIKIITSHLDIFILFNVTIIATKTQFRHHPRVHFFFRKTENYFCFFVLFYWINLSRLRKKDVTMKKQIYFCESNKFSQQFRNMVLFVKNHCVYLLCIFIASRQEKKTFLPSLLQGWLHAV